MKSFLLIFAFLILAFLLVDFSRSAFLIWKNRKVMQRALPFQNINPEAGIKLLFIGDSTARGTGAETPRVSVAGYFHQDFPDAHIVNLGINGNTTEKLAERFDPDQYKNFDAVIVHTGGNDILRFTPLGKIQKDLETILRKVAQVSDTIVLLHSGNVGLAPLLPRVIAPLLTYRTLRVRELFMSVSRRYGAVYVDLFTTRENDPFLKDPKKFYAPDYLHPSGEGYRIWYEKIRNAMRAGGIQLEG